MEKDIISKIDSITNLTESQVDRSKVGELARDNLFRFLNGYMAKTSSKNDLKVKIEKLLLDKIEIEGEDLPYGVLIKLLEVLTKNEVEAATPILKIIENATKQPESPLNPHRSCNEDENDESSKITTDEYKSVKKLIKFIDDLEKTEFPEKEKK